MDTVDLSAYTENIRYAEDRPLFEDAVRAANAGALRAAYIMIWLSCAESLKRRFREAQRRDVAAGQIVGKIQTKESNHQSVDKYVLEEAKNYGFISDSEHTILLNVYDLRCVYGHPYEVAPLKEQVSNAAAAVCEYVLARPIKLKHGFGQQLLKSMLEDRTFLDDQASAVRSFATDITPKLDETIYGWFFDKYWEELEDLANDSSMALFFKRGIWFSRALLSDVGVAFFSDDDWHDRVGRFPQILMRVCSISTVYENIGLRAQDSLVGAILEEAKTHAKVLIHLERLDEQNLLSERQQERFNNRLVRMDSDDLVATGLSTRTCYDKLILALQSHNWYKQNPAANLIRSNGPEQVAALTEEQQIELGRNILQACDGNARNVCGFLRQLPDAEESWPEDFILGIILEVFVNEEDELRAKDRRFGAVVELIESIDELQRDSILSQVAEAVDNSTPDRYLESGDFEDVLEALSPFDWATQLIDSLNDKLESLPVEEDD